MLNWYVLAKLPHGHAARDVSLVSGVVSFAGEPAILPEVDVLDMLTPRTGIASPVLSRKARRLARHIRQLEAGAAR